ncbi:MAG: hypothetical protein ACSLFK_01530 [Gemmatimonadaceae bacterium]
MRRTIRTPISGWLPAAFLAAALALACTPDLPTEASVPNPVFAKGGKAPPLYTSTDFGKLLGSYSSWANDVNDAGEMVGASCCGTGSGGFAVVGGTPIVLPGGASDVLAISNGTPRYVVGWGGAPSQPMRWVITNGQPSQAEFLQPGDTTWGAARGVNDAGAAVGSAGSYAAMWNSDGSVALTFKVSGFLRGEGRDINNAGHAVFVFSGPGPDWQSARGYLRLASGQLVLLPPLSGDVGSYANDVSQVANGAIHIAGSSRATPYDFRSVRWTVDVATGAITQTEIRSENSHALGVSNGGAVTGFIEPVGGSLGFKAFLWRGSEFLSLGPPKSTKDPRAWGISPSGEFIAGEAFSGTQRHAVRWTVTP